MLAVVLEEAGRALLPEPLLLSSVLGVHAVLAAPADAIAADVVRGAMDGSLVVTVALDGGAGAALSLSGEDGATRVSGRLDRVPLGGSADLVVVTVGPGRGSPPTSSTFAPEGVATRTTLVTLDLTRRQARLDLDVAPAYQIAGRGETDALVTELAILRRVGLAAEHVGMVEAILELTRTHLRQRHQFGRSLASFQAIKHRLADVLVDLERARSAAGMPRPSSTRTRSRPSSPPPSPRRSAPTR